MKVLMLNGSCNPKGCTYTALTEVGKTLTAAGIDYEESGRTVPNC